MSRNHHPDLQSVSWHEQSARFVMHVEAVNIAEPGTACTIPRRRNPHVLAPRTDVNFIRGSSTFKRG